MATALPIKDGKAAPSIPKFTGQPLDFPQWHDAVGDGFIEISPSYIVEGPETYDESHVLLQDVTQDEWIRAQRVAYRLLVQTMPADNPQCKAALSMLQSDKKLYQVASCTLCDLSWECQNCC